MYSLAEFIPEPVINVILTPQHTAREREKEIFSLAVIFDVSIIRYPNFFFFYYFSCHWYYWNLFNAIWSKLFSKSFYQIFKSKFLFSAYNGIQWHTKYRISNPIDVFVVCIYCVVFLPEIIWCVSNFPNYYCLNVAFISVIVNKPLTLHAIGF